MITDIQGDLTASIDVSSFIKTIKQYDLEDKHTGRLKHFASIVVGG